MAVRRLLPLLLLVLLATPWRGDAQETPSQDDAGALPFQYVDTELPEIVKAVAARTGRRFVYDDRLRGRVSITAPRPVRNDETLALLQAALRMTGFALVPGADGSEQIVPLAESAGRVPFSSSTPRAFVDAPITTLVPLRAASAEVLLPVVQSMLGTNAVVQAFAPTNVLLLSATEAQLHRALIVVRALDQAEARQLVVLRPRYRAAEDLLPLVEQTFPESRRASETLRVFLDARSDALLLEGPTDTVEEVREFVRTIDLPTPGQGGIHVIRLRHADAAELAEVVQQAAKPISQASDIGNPPPDVAAAADVLAGRDFTLSVDAPTNALVLRSDVETFRAIAQLVAELDVDVPSVSVKTTLLEVEDTGSLDFAIDSILPFTRPGTPSEGNGFLRTLNSGDPSLLGAQPTDGTASFVLRFLKDPVTFTRIGADGQPVTETVPSYAINIRATQTDNDTTLLSEPHIVARSGEEQEIFVGNNIPIISATQSSAAGEPAATGAAPVSTANPLTISQNIERQDVGVTLRVEPTVPTEGPVRLELRVDYSALTAPFAGDPDEVGPTLVTQSVESTIYLADGAGAVVGVRGEPTQDVVRTGTPWLMDVPVIGWMFKSISTRTVRKDLILTVQVKVIRSAEDFELESIRRRNAVERNLAGLVDLPVSAEEAPFAVWVATTVQRDQAESIAAGLDLGPRRAEVVAWKAGEPKRFDVFVLGFDRYPDAMETSLEIRDRGFEPEVVALPGRP